MLQQRADRPDVMTGRESQVSAQHAVAVSLIFGAAGLAQFTDEAVHDPRVSAFRQKVKLAVVPGTPVPDVRVDVVYADGRTEEIQVKDARGTDNRPLTDKEIEEKFRTLAATYAPDCGEREIDRGGLVVGKCGRCQPDDGPTPCPRRRPRPTPVPSESGPCRIGPHRGAGHSRE